VQGSFLSGSKVMRITLTRQQLIDLKPCDLSERLKLFGVRDKLTIRQAIKAGATVSDLLWVAGRRGPEALPSIVTFARNAAARAPADAAYAASSSARAAAYAASSSARAAEYAARYAARYASRDAARAAEVKQQLADLVRLFG